MPNISRDSVVPEDIRHEVEKFVSSPPVILDSITFDWSVPGRSDLLEKLEAVRKEMERLHGRGIEEREVEKREKYWELWLRSRTLLFEAFRLGMWSMVGIYRNLNRAGVVPIYLADTPVIRTPFREFLSWETGEILFLDGSAAAEKIKMTA